MRRGFTLLELLAVIAIMGIMGAVTVSGYRQMRRGMEERSVIQNATQFIRAAYQRAQIDRQPVTIYFWNETLQGTDDGNLVVVGKAVAVRRYGRVTMVKGNYLYDEFGDLKFNRKITSEDDETGSTSYSSGGAGVNFYRLNGNEGANPAHSVVYEMTANTDITEPLLLGGTGSERIECFAYELKDKGGIDWKIGDAYGFEFAEITLPRGFIFGSQFSRSSTSPAVGHQTMRFKPGKNSGNGAQNGTQGASTITISSLRPDAKGSLSADQVGKTDSPTERLD